MKPAGQDAAILPKFDMRPFTSTLNMGLIEWINKTYNVLEDLHPRVTPKGMTMAELPNDAIQLYIHHFKQVVKMVEFLCFLNFGGCKMVVVGPLQPGAVHVTYTTPLMARLEDVPSKTRLMGYTVQPYPKVLVEKQKKCLKAVEKAATKAAQGVDALENKKAVGKRHVGERGTYRPNKKKARQETPLTVNMSYGYISSPVPLNHSKPLDTLADAPYACEGAFVGRLDVLRNQTNEKSPPHHGVVQENLEENMLIDDAERNVADDNVVHQEGGGDNSDGGSGVKICYDGCKKELTKLQVEHQDKVVAYDLLLKHYEAALNVEKGLHDRVDKLEEEKKEWESAQEKQAA
uniref:Uncharacterized protein n=1 Tax=Tanacetum cinerariifolium TaxID=118510 RepID=A0A699HPH3_TANCI|nr:hypothetical protein [Tanacetum cinerariifolium]